MIETTIVSLNFAPFPLAKRRAVLLGGREFSTFGAKTAVCYLRYRGDDVAAVVDPTQGGRRVEDIVGFGGDIPVVANVEDALSLGVDIAIVGVAPQGGRLEDVVRSQVLRCAGAGIDIVSGLHDFLADDQRIAETARRHGARLWDVRMVPPGQTVGTGGGCRTGARTVLVVGSDCNVGKMTATVELFNSATKRGVGAAWAATGQTGMMLRERGIAIDRVVADFISGATEELVEFEGRDQDLLLVEGQGSLVHPGYAGVTLGLMHGAMPDCQVLVHAPSRVMIGDSSFEMPDLPSLIRLYEAAMEPLKNSPVVAVALNTSGFESATARDTIETAKEATGLPVSDPVRFGAEAIIDAVLDHVA